MGNKSNMNALICCSKAYYDNSDSYTDWYPNEHTADRQQIHHGDSRVERGRSTRIAALPLVEPDMQISRIRLSRKAFVK